MEQPDLTVSSNEESQFGALLSRISRQSFLVLFILGLVMLGLKGWGAMLSFLFGGIVLLVAGRLTGSGLIKATRADPEAGRKVLLAGAAKKFLMVLCSLLIANVIGMNLLLVAAGIFVAQLIVAIIGFRYDYNNDLS